ncbi:MULTISPECIES: SIMPL domain-containing protein [unclassified Methanoregula]|uniref:SIMPL domain-containing protein n=1 Tax=unclassified Methanoregula TaxID=2649730 RepID=UPI0009D44EE3|nr:MULTISPECIES: SIMPL domain-containing protein [unclassified Methanoregula]OPX64935.1 MAG: oxidative stress defense protein [Methanoregula sp. PtaB.Bin085]OPY32987.1 MAG: oxidative stress defense protein [Methanoregula sp. PtaU1.Bin006]
MKGTIRILTLGLIVALALVGCASAASETTNEHVIQTTGTGNVITTPDRAQVTFAVQTENQDVKLAQTENAVKMSKVRDVLLASGIPRDALKTTGYNIYPIYEDSVGLLKPKIKTYQVTNRLTVTLHDINKTGEVIDTAVASGINQADSIQFMLSDEKSQQVRTEALKEAVARAKSDADTISAAMGTVIRGVQRAETGSSYSPVYFQNYALDNAAPRAVAETPIQSGDITVSASVTITYLI